MSFYTCVVCLFVHLCFWMDFLSLLYRLVCYTVEPLNNGYVGTRHFVLYREVVLSSEVKHLLV